MLMLGNPTVGVRLYLHASKAEKILVSSLELYQCFSFRAECFRAGLFAVRGLGLHFLSTCLLDEGNELRYLTNLHFVKI